MTCQSWAAAAQTAAADRDNTEATESAAADSRESDIAETESAALAALDVRSAAGAAAIDQSYALGEVARENARRDEITEADGQHDIGRAEAERRQAIDVAQAEKAYQHALVVAGGDYQAQQDAAHAKTAAVADADMRLVSGWSGIEGEDDLAGQADADLAWQQSHSAADREFDVAEAAAEKAAALAQAALDGAYTVAAAVPAAVREVAEAQLQAGVSAQTTAAENAAQAAAGSAQATFSAAELADSVTAYAGLAAGLASTTCADWTRFLAQEARVAATWLGNTAPAAADELAAEEAAWSDEQGVIDAAAVDEAVTLAGDDVSQARGTSDADRDAAGALASAQETAVTGTTGVPGYAPAAETYRNAAAAIERTFQASVATLKRSLDVGEIGQQQFDAAVLALTNDKQAALQAPAQVYSSAEAATDAALRNSTADADSALTTALEGTGGVLLLSTQARQTAATTFDAAQSDAECDAETAVAGLQSAYDRGQTAVRTQALAALADASPTPWAERAAAESAAEGDLVEALAPAEATLEGTIADKDRDRSDAIAAADAVLASFSAAASATADLAAATAESVAAYARSAAEIAFALTDFRVTPTPEVATPPNEGESINPPAESDEQFVDEEYEQEQEQGELNDTAFTEVTDEAIRRNGGAFQPQRKSAADGKVIEEGLATKPLGATPAAAPNAAEEAHNAAVKRILTAAGPLPDLAAALKAGPLPGLNGFVARDEAVGGTKITVKPEADLARAEREYNAAGTNLQRWWNDMVGYASKLYDAACKEGFSREEIDQLFGQYVRPHVWKGLEEFSKLLDSTGSKMEKLAFDRAQKLADAMNRSLDAVGEAPDIEDYIDPEALREEVKEAPVPALEAISRRPGGLPPDIAYARGDMERRLMGERFDKWADAMIAYREKINEATQANGLPADWLLALRCTPAEQNGVEFYDEARASNYANQSDAIYRAVLPMWVTDPDRARALLEAKLAQAMREINFAYSMNNARVAAASVVVTGFVGGEALAVGSLPWALWTADQETTAALREATGSPADTLGGQAIQGVLGDGKAAAVFRFGYDYAPLIAIPISIARNSAGLLRISTGRAAPLADAVRGSLKLARRLHADEAGTVYLFGKPPGAAAAKSPFAVPAGFEDLAVEAAAFRTRTLSFEHGNVAVFEYAQNGQVRTIATISEPNTAGGGLTSHAERLLGNRPGELSGGTFPGDLANLGIQRDQVTRIYSELEFCATRPFRCSNLIANVYPNAGTAWQFPYNGVDRAAGVDAWRRYIERLRAQTTARLR